MTFVCPPQSTAPLSTPRQRHAGDPVDAIDAGTSRVSGAAARRAGPRWRTAGKGATVMLALLGLSALAGCSTFQKMPIPFVKKRGPDLTNGRASAENMVRLDAAIRSGCDVVDNIERPPAKQDPRDPAPQRWVARTCHGDIVYDVTTLQGANGPQIKVTPVPGPIDRPMNTHFVPAGIEGGTPAGRDSGAPAAPADSDDHAPLISK